jgi:plastocyanin
LGHHGDNPIKRIVLAASLLSLAASPAFAQTDWSGARRVEIAMSNYAFAPQELHLQHGVPYVLHFTNTASKSHDFSAPAFFAAATVAADDRAKVVDGGVDLDENASTDVKLVPGTPGTYAVECTHFMHAMMGMTGKVIVE